MFHLLVWHSRRAHRHRLHEFMHDAACMMQTHELRSDPAVHCEFSQLICLPWRNGGRSPQEARLEEMGLREVWVSLPGNFQNIPPKLFQASHSFSITPETLQNPVIFVTKKSSPVMSKGWIESAGGLLQVLVWGSMGYTVRTCLQNPKQQKTKGRTEKQQNRNKWKRHRVSYNFRKN